MQFFQKLKIFFFTNDSTNRMKTVIEVSKQAHFEQDLISFFIAVRLPIPSHEKNS